MKSKILFTFLSMFIAAQGLALECSQEEGDYRYDLKVQDHLMAILHTNDSDVTEVVAYDAVESYQNGEVHTVGRYILVRNTSDSFSSLYKKVGNKNVLLSDIMTCSEEDLGDINDWVTNNSTTGY